MPIIKSIRIALNENDISLEQKFFRKKGVKTTNMIQT